MKERPILFNGEMVRAILEGRKTQTRRVVKSSNPLGIQWTGERWAAIRNDGTKGHELKCPYGEPEDRLWVREAAYISKAGWCSKSDASHIDADEQARMVDYAATMTRDAVRIAEEYGIKKSPSIHMPRWASRISLTVERIRPQRIQDISEDDAHAEGIPRRNGTYILDFAKLWDEINAGRGYSWNSNPWVWVVEFSVLTDAD